MSVGRSAHLQGEHARRSAEGAVAQPTIGVQAMTAGCDGSLYAVESVPQIARISADGTIEEYPLESYGSIDGITRASDCSIWFTAGTHGPRQQVAEFSLEREAGARTAVL